MERFVTINGNRFWVATRGDGALPVALCHGGPGGFDDQEPVAAMVDDMALTVRYDQRGCGRSEAKSPFDLATYLADLDGLRAVLGFDRWIVGGHSWGAGLALAYAVRFPERVQGLIYISGTGLTGAWKEAYRANRWAKLSAVEQERFVWLRDQLKSSTPLPAAKRALLDAEYVRLYRYTDYADRDAADRVPAPAYPGNYEVNAILNAEWEAYAPTVTAEMLARVTCPALVLHGEADPRPAWPAQAVARALPCGEFMLLPGVGHYPYLESPGTLRQALREFLGRIG